MGKHKSAYFERPRGLDTNYRCSACGYGSPLYYEVDNHIIEMKSRGK